MDKNLSGVHILRVEVEKPLWVLRDDLNEERAGIRGDWYRFTGNKLRGGFISSQGTGALQRTCWEVRKLVQFIGRTMTVVFSICAELSMLSSVRKAIETKDDGYSTQYLDRLCVKSLFCLERMTKKNSQ